MEENDKVKLLKDEIDTILGRLNPPKKAVVTAGMPYANGPIHIGHLAGAHVPPDIYTRYLKMMIGKDNVLFVCGSDDHGSNAEVTARKEGLETKEFIEKVHSMQKRTFENYSISFDKYAGTSRSELFEDHKNFCQDFLRKLHQNNMLEKRTSKQWYDPEIKMFLPDRFVFGDCPKCDNKKAYSNECDDCGSVYESSELKNPKSTASQAEPELKDTDHWFLNMWKVTDQLIEWLQTKQKVWKKNVYNEIMGTVLPSLQFSNTFENKYKELKDALPKHKSRYAPGKMVVVQFNNLNDLNLGREVLNTHSIQHELLDGWAHRSITRDVSWGIPVPEDIDPSMKGKTFYVWPESLIAPISFTRNALKEKDQYKDYWCNPDSKVFQFLGIDNAFFYVLMQGSMWFGTQEDPFRQPKPGELQLTEIFSQFHLQIEGKKMSKTKGNFYTADELIEKHGHDSDQVRYYLALLSLSEKESNFDFEDFKRRNDFLQGPMNAAFEKPISACHSKFGGVIPDGKLIGKTEKETKKIIQIYTKFMMKGEFAKAIFALENYARVINSLFANYKPHDDRHPEIERKDALFSSFYILKNILIMLHPVAPKTMDRLRETLNLSEDVFSLNELGVPFPSAHQLNPQVDYFPKTES